MKKLLLMLGVTIALSSCKSVAPFLVSDQDEKTVGLQYHTFLKDSLTAKGQILPMSDKQAIWIDSLGKALAQKQDRSNYSSSDFTFTVVDDAVINAFALPGGYIYIYEGLINKAATVDQIAGVLAHEIGHVAASHYKEVMVKSAGVEFLSQILLGDNSSVAGNVGKYLIGMKTSRMNEYEADSLSLAYVAEDGKLSPWGMKEFLDTLATLGGSNAEILSSHPDSEKRATTVKSMIEKQYPLALQGAGKPNPYKK